MRSEGLNQRFCSLSAFDLDHTLFSDNGSYRFGLYLCKRKLLPYKSLAFILSCNIRHAVGLLSIVNLHESAFIRLFKGRSQVMVKEWTEDFLQENFDNLLYSPAIKKLKSAQKAGHLTAILSSSPDFLVEPIAKKLNVPIWKSTQYTIDKDQRFSQIKNLMLGHDKAQVLNQLMQYYQISKQETFAYSDSHLDLPFLLAAGFPCGVNPNRKLKSLCKRHHWPMI